MNEELTADIIHVYAEDAIHKKLLNLLYEIDEICVQEKIPYFLEGYTALAAYRDHIMPKRLVNPIVSMYATDIDKFIKAVKQKQNPNRYLDYMGEDPHFPNFILHYGDRNSTYCEPHLTHIIKHCGLHITIIPLRRSNLNSLNYRIMYGLESAWESANITKKVSLKRLIATIGTRVICKIVGYRRYSSWLFKRLISVSSQKNGTLYTKALWERIKKRNEIFYRGTSRVMIDGVSLMMSHQPKHYLNANFVGWAKRKINVPNIDSSKCFVSAIVPYDKVLNHFGKKWGSMQWKLLEKRRRLSSKADSFAQQNAYVWDRVSLTGDRFYFWSLLMPEKEAIKELYKQEEYEKIRKKMAPYLKALQRSIKRGIPLCFDRELLDIALCVLYEGRDYATLKSIKAKIPREYMQPISIKSY